MSAVTALHGQAIESLAWLIANKYKQCNTNYTRTTVVLLSRLSQIACVDMQESGTKATMYTMPLTTTWKANCLLRNGESLHHQRVGKIRINEKIDCLMQKYQLHERHN
jgi:hypothetical protein